MHQMTWARREKEIAHRAYQAAYERECDGIVRKVQEMASSIEDRTDLWGLHDYLTKKRRETDDKYDFRYSVLIQVFSQVGQVNDLPLLFAEACMSR